MAKKKSVKGVDALEKDVGLDIPDITPWDKLLSRTKEGTLKAHPHNVYVLLANHYEWDGVLAFNEFSQKIVKLKSPPYAKAKPGVWDEMDDLRTASWLVQKMGLHVNVRQVMEGVSVAADDNCYHPVRDYLGTLMWDGQPRAERWLHTYLGADDNEYTRLVGLKWLVSAVARVFRPGCRAQHVLILEGLQGLGKSTAMSVLASNDWFMDTPFSLGDKDGYMMMRGKWIIELGELDSFNKAESTKAKQFFSAPVDTYREAYGRRVVDVPRQCVFVGTTNQDAYLKDPTGNRRYWPVQCKKMDYEALERDRDQIWAEVDALFTDGAIWHPTSEEQALVQVEQDKRYMGDAWENLIRDWLEDAGQCMHDHYTTTEILAGALKLDAAHMMQPQQQRVGTIMSRLGWSRKRITRDGARPWAYERPNSPANVVNDDESVPPVPTAF